MSFAIVANKVADNAFRARLGVAITEQCRFMLEQPQGARSVNRFAWDLNLARVVLQQVAQESHLSRFARLCLLPSVWGAFDPDADAALQGRVGERFVMFAADSPPV